MTFRLRGGEEIELAVGDDVHLAVLDSGTTEGLRAVTGQVTAVDAEQNAVWVRGVRVDLADAQVQTLVDTDDPANLTPPPA